MATPRIKADQDALQALKRLASLSPETLSAFVECVNGVSTPDCIRQAEWLEETAAAIGVEEDTLVNGFTAFATLFFISKKEEREFASVLDIAAGDELDSCAKEALMSLSERAQRALGELYETWDRETPPSCSIREYVGMQTRILTLYEFKKEFHLVHNTLDGYKPEVKTPHKCVYVQITTRDQQTKDVLGFRLRRNEIDDVITFLQFARLQLDAVE